MVFATKSEYVPGLEGIVAAQTRLSCVDGAAGELILAGYRVEDLAARASFEEVVHLLWYDALPDAVTLAAFRTRLGACRCLPEVTRHTLRAAASRSLPVMDALRMATATLDLPALQEPLEQQDEALAGSVLSRFPTIIAAYWRMLHGKPPLEPIPDLGHAANYLYMLFGEIPHPSRVRALETYLNTVVDHGLNASTFAARVIVSTGSDLVSAVTGAVGALKGALHGGAPGPALDMVFEIGVAERVEEYLRAKLARRERLMGFGHRVYRVRDPRADILELAARQLYQESGDTAFYDLARQIEKAAIALLAEHYPQRRLQTNVEFYTALLLHGLELPASLFTPTFALSRAAGWIAHCLEQQSHGRLIRPESEYVGPTDRIWRDLEKR